MKKTKKFFTLTLSLILILPIFSMFSSAASTGITEFSVLADIGENQVEIEWWQDNGKYYLFMPSDANLTGVTVNYTASKEVTLNGEVLTPDSTISLTANTEYTLSCNDNTYTLYVLKSDGLPSLHITTESGSMDKVHADKSHKEPASIVVASEGQVILEKELEYIKGRGNATWTYAKKPYNIKFDKKTELFGMDKAKKWTLLANYSDETIMRNHVAFSLAESLGIPFTAEHIYVDLYIDNEYYGNYILCESVEIGDGRVDINDLTGDTEDANPDIDIEDCEFGGNHETNFRKLTANTQKWVNIPNNPDDITGGYLLEYELPDRYVNEVSGFVTKQNQTIVIKEPEYASEAQVKYISAFYQEFEDAIYSETGYNSLNKHYSEYIDFNSIVMMYIFQEYSKNLDAAITSFYIYKDTGSDKFIAAPVWDFDKAFGESQPRFGMDIATPDGWWAGIIYHWTDNAINTLPTMLNMLYRKDDFFSAACEKWQSELAPLITDEYITELSVFADALTPSAVMNAIRWKAYSTVNYEDTAAMYIETVQNNLLDFLTGRKAFLNEGFSDTSVRILYETNEGKGNMYNESAPQIGDSFSIPYCSFNRSGFDFVAWNTKADGSGTSYYPGDVITLNQTRLSLYAQWAEKVEIPDEPTTPDEPSENSNFFTKMINAIREFFQKIAELFRNLFS